jgi:hypothetical protein
LHSGLRLLAVGDVGLDCQGGAAGGLDLVDQGVEPVLARENGDGSPCSANARAVASPMPLLAPVTIATVPSRAVMFN